MPVWVSKKLKNLDRLYFGQKYSRKDIARIGDVKIPGNRDWSGIVRFANCILLFVNLDKSQQQIKEHKYSDYFDIEYFFWQSQASNTENTPSIKNIIEGLDTRLYCRKKASGLFVYCGELIYKKHWSEKPVNFQYLMKDYSYFETPSDLQELYDWSPPPPFQHMTNLNYLHYEIDEIDLSLRSVNALRSADINLVSELVKKYRHELMRISNLGNTSLNEITDKLNELGLHLGWQTDVDEENNFEISENDLDYEIEELELSVRSENALKKAGINTLDDLVRKNYEELLWLPNLGNKSLKEIKQCLEAIGLNLASVGLPYEKKIAKFKPNNQEFVSQIETIINNNTSTSERARILRRRIFGAYTLEEAGKELDLTRERIRQIEESIVRRFYTGAFSESIVSKIKPLCNNRKSPLFLFRLEMEEPWFNGITKLITNSKKGQEFFETITSESEEIQCEIIDKKLVFSLTNQGTFKQIYTSVTTGEPDLDIKNWIQFRCRLKGRPELAEIVNKKYRKKILSSHRRVAVQFTPLIIKENQGPMNGKEVIQKIEEKIGIKVTAGAVSNAFLEDENLFSFGHSIGWDHEDNFRKLNDEEVKEVATAIISIMKTNQAKQWGLEVLSEELMKNPPAAIINCQDEFTKYDLDWVLKKSLNYQEKLLNLGRGMWQFSETKGASSERKQLVHLAIEALDKKGRPMKTVDIFNEIKKVRDINETHQFHAKGDLVHIDRAHFGLRDRDINFSQTEQKEIFDKLESKIKEYPDEFFSSQKGHALIWDVVREYFTGESLFIEILNENHSAFEFEIYSRVLNYEPKYVGITKSGKKIEYSKITRYQFVRLLRMDPRFEVEVWESQANIKLTS